MNDHRTWYNVVNNIPPSLRDIIKALQREARHGVMLGSNKRYLRDLIKGADSYYDQDPAKSDDVVRFLKNTRVLLEESHGGAYYFDSEVADKLSDYARDNRVVIPTHDPASRLGHLKQLFSERSRAPAAVPTVPTATPSQPAPAPDKSVDTQLAEMYATENEALKSELVTTRKRIGELEVAHGTAIAETRSMTSRVDSLKVQIASIERSRGELKEKLEAAERLRPELAARDKRIGELETALRSAAGPISVQLLELATRFEALSATSAPVAAPVPVLVTPVSPDVDVFDAGALRREVEQRMLHLIQQMTAIEERLWTLTGRLEAVNEDIGRIANTRPELVSGWAQDANPELKELMEERGRLEEETAKLAERSKPFTQMKQQLGLYLKSLDTIERGIPSLEELQAAQPAAAESAAQVSQAEAIEAIATREGLPVPAVMVITLYELVQAVTKGNYGVGMKRVIESAVTAKLVEEEHKQALYFSRGGSDETKKALARYLVVRPSRTPAPVFVRTAVSLPWSIGKLLTPQQRDKFTEIFTNYRNAEADEAKH